MEIFFENIDNYLEGTLSTTDKVAFEQAMVADKTLAKEVALYQDLLKGIELGADYSLKNTIENVQKSLKNEGFFLNDTDIDQYLVGNLAEDKKAGFDTRLKNDTEFAADVDFQRDLIKGIEIGADSDLRDKIKHIHQNFESGNILENEEKTTIIRQLNTENQVKIRKIGYSWWAAAASIALLVAVGFWYFSKPKTTTSDLVFNQYFKPENERVKNIYSELSAEGFAVDKIRNNSLKTGLSDYQMKNYSEAKRSLEIHIGLFKDDIDAQFYLSMTYICLNEKEKAIPLLEPLAQGKSTWAQEAKWYLALIYIDLPDMQDEGIKYFKEIAADSNSPYQAKAREILNKR